MRILKFILIFFAANAIAQKPIASRIQQLYNQNADFTEFAPLDLLEYNSEETNRIVEKSTYTSPRLYVISQIFTSRPNTIALQIPYQGATLTIDLFKVSIYSEGFHVDTDKSKNINFQKGVHYRGIIRNSPNSVASFNFYDGHFDGIISDNTLQNLVIAKEVGSANRYLVYSDADLLIPNTFTCAAKDPQNFRAPQARQTNAVQSLRCVTTYFEIDHDLYLANNSDVEQTTEWMTSVFNNVQTIFENDGITIALKSVFVWTEDDPYEGETSADYLFQFNDVRPVFDGDVGQLVGLDPGGLGGVAVTINGLCSQFNFSYSDVEFNFATVPTFSWTIQVITHEFGHLLGSPHTHACVWNGDNTSIDGCGTQAGYEEGNCGVGPIPSGLDQGTIMSYCHLLGGVGINFVNGFGPQPAELMMLTIDQSACLSFDCVNTCINTIAEISAENVTNTTATLVWNDISENPGNYEIAVSPLNAGGGSFVPVSGNTLDLSNLSPNTFYIAEVRPTCTDAEPVARRQLFATAADWCSGVTISDSGGPFQDYNDGDSYVRVLIPNQPQKAIRLEFSSFDLEWDYDYLYIYDGAGTTSPELTGGLTGDINPGVFTSTSPDGALTLRFEADVFITDDGYTAEISCEENLNVGEMSGVVDFRYYPNPSKGMVSLQSNERIFDVKIYNVQGQLLYTAQPDLNETVIDMTSFASGTYFYKVQTGNQQVNFKIVRQ